MFKIMRGNLKLTSSVGLLLHLERDPNTIVQIVGIKFLQTVHGEIF